MYFDLSVIIEILSLALLLSVMSLALRLGSGLILGQIVQRVNNVIG